MPWDNGDFEFVSSRAKFSMEVVMKRFYLLILLMFIGFVGQIPAADILDIKSGAISLDMGSKNGVSIGTIFNVYRNKEIVAEFGNLKITTRIFPRRWAQKQGNTYSQRANVLHDGLKTRSQLISRFYANTMFRPSLLQVTRMY